MSKFLVIQTAFLGDAILTVPIIDSLRSKFKNAYIAILTTPQNKDVFTLNPSIDEIVLYDKHGLDNNIFSTIKKIKLIRKKIFDFIITNHPSPRTALISYFSGANVRIALSSTALKFLYTATVSTANYNHQIDKNLALLKSIDFNESELVKKINLYYAKEDENLINSVLEANSIKDENKIVVVNPTSAWPTKRWPKEYFKELCSMLSQNGYLVLLIGTQKDYSIGEYIKNNKRFIVNLIGQTTLKELFALISKTNLLISNDSAPIHIASAFNIPTIVIYGPTVPEFGFYPLSQKKVIFEVKDLNCRPCGQHGSNTCKRSHFECMRRINAQDVFKAAIELL